MARSISFIVEGEVNTQVTITELGDGTLQVDLLVLDSGSIGDLRGLFFDLEGYVADDSLTATGTDVTGEVSGEGSVDRVEKDVNVKGEVSNELGDFDIGIEFGTSGMSGDDIQSTSFILSDPDQALTLDMVNLSDFGLRYTSVGEEDGTRTDSAKIGGESSGVAQNDVLAADENGSNSLNLLANDENSGNTISSVSFDGTSYAAGVAIPLTIGGLNYGTLTVLADGTATLDATGADVDSLSAIQSVSFDLTYTAVAPDGSSASADVQLTINGLNDDPIITEGGQTTGNVEEDGTLQASGQLAATDPDDNSSLTWAVSGGGGGLLGSIIIDQAGQWTYTLDNDNPMVQAMAAGDTFDEVFEITVTDEYGAQDTQLVTVTVTGADDGPTIDNSWVGTPWNDVFYGYPENTQIDALDGNDYITGDYYYARDTYTWDGSAYVDHLVTYNENQWEYVDPVFGDDVIDAGPGYDTAMGDAWQIYINNFYSHNDREFTTGSDIISGDSENDWLMGDSYVAQLYSANNGTTISMTFGADEISGGAGGDSISGDAWYAYNYYANIGSQSLMTFGNDILSGGDDGDWIYGDACFFQPYYNLGGTQLITAGDDTISGDGGGDYLYGDAQYVQIYQVAPGGSSQIIAGSDLIDGGAGNDVIYGDGQNGYQDTTSYGGSSGHMEIIAGDDILIGGEDHDVIYGDFWTLWNYPEANFVLGDDIIDGGSGNDALWGDFSSFTGSSSGNVVTGADTFVFATGSGLDTIHDYELGQDLIDVTGYGVTSLAGLTITDDGVHTTIDFDGTASDIDEVVILYAVGLTDTDFVFAV